MSDRSKIEVTATASLSGDGDASNHALLDSLLEMIERCRLSVARLRVTDETSRAELLDGLAIAEINVQRLIEDERRGA